MAVNEAFVSSLNSANTEIKVFGSSTPIDNVNAEIASFGKLPYGWAYGRGGPIRENVLQAARNWNDKLRLAGFANVEAFPGDEEVLLAASDGDHYFELIIEADCTISIAYDYKGKQVFYRAHMDEAQAMNTILEIKGRKWSASGFYIRADTMRRNINLPDLHSAILQQTELFPSLIGTVFRGQVIQSERISGHTTKNTVLLFGSHPSFGSLTRRRLPRGPHDRTRQ